MENKKEIDRLVKGMPALTEQAIEQTNALFPAYIFRVHKKRELWTTCCRRHVVLPKQGWSAAEDDVMAAPHRREEYREYPGCGAAWGGASRRPEEIACPYCGKLASVKEMGRTGDRKNLWCYRRSVVLRQWRGALWAVAYDCEKDYRGACLTAAPSFHAIGIYRFRMGFAEGTSRYWWGECAWNAYQTQKRPPKSGGHWMKAPYGYTRELGTGYELVCLNELERSEFRYCAGADILHSGADLIGFLSACCFYPRQIEMLQKAGLEQPIRDLVYRACYNRKAFSWEETNPARAFGVSMPELREFLAGDRSITELACYKRMKKAGMRVEFAEIGRLSGLCPQANLERIVSRLAKYRLRPDKLLAYLEREASGKKKAVSLWTMTQMWLDYAAAAEIVKLDLHNPVFLTPRGLIGKHDEITRAAQAFAVKAQDKSYRKNRLRKLTRRYTYSDGEYLIRPPVSAAEIVREGEALHHCVGGYADRHIKGSTTILFLRERSRPGKPFVTIEMRGNEIQQIHGAHDDVYSHIQQRKARASILDPWLLWLEAGSRRKKSGEPVPQGTRKKQEAKIA